MTEFRVIIDLLQWVGFGFILLGYWQYGRNLKRGAVLSCFGCLACLTWALLIEPRAWGIFSLECLVIAINIENYRRAEKKEKP